MSVKMGETTIARWHGNKAGAFCLMFDDSIGSDVKTVVPELRKRNLVGTFYVNPGGGAWHQYADAWEKEFPTVPTVVYANHTMTHQGARSVEQLTDELTKCNEVLYKIVPGPKPRLISFGRPGVKKEDWTVTEAQLADQLKRLHLIERPPFGDHGAMIGPKTPEQMLRFADNAIEKHGMEYLVFHGVGGDWIITPTEIFTRFLDLLETRRDRLWITDPISAHIYQTLHDQSDVGVASADSRQIRLTLTTRADPAFYKGALTLITAVPPPWKQCEITQKTVRIRATPKAGLLRYDANPHSGPITLRPI